jgi:hypothetical protein
MLSGRGYFAGLRVTKRNKATVLLTLTLLQTPTLTLLQIVSKPILKKKVLTKCHSEVSEIVDAMLSLGFTLSKFCDHGKIRIFCIDNSLRFEKVYKNCST